MMLIQIWLPSSRLWFWSGLSGSHLPDVFSISDLGMRLLELVLLIILTTSKPNNNSNYTKHTTIVTLTSNFWSFFRNFYGFLRNRNAFPQPATPKKQSNKKRKKHHAHFKEQVSGATASLKATTKHLPIFKKFAIATIAAMEAAMDSQAYLVIRPPLTLEARGWSGRSTTWETSIKQVI